MSSRQRSGSSANVPVVEIPRWQRDTSVRDSGRCRGLGVAVPWYGDMNVTLNLKSIETIKHRESMSPQSLRAKCQYLFMLIRRNIANDLTKIPSFPFSRHLTLALVCIPKSQDSTSRLYPSEPREPPGALFRPSTHPNFQ
ncbi:hypothetical protein AG1IA_09863 [Rhizoctonia solani AG-1 IA]|uniref:Uncharacterized protein n=1 Tax=Thanatephorus cucumeris (strain AG1-IA) TaxID=983506 RepID=L8WH98_THACA|nr:hypothetical protein AG1IA_09863 [Rhizoctonia solani AG-1 IA]